MPCSERLKRYSQPPSDIRAQAGSWPAAFVREMLTVVIQALNDRSLAPLAARLDAADTDRSFHIGGGAADAARISGTKTELLAWGRRARYAQWCRQRQGLGQVEVSQVAGSIGGWWPGGRVSP
jgi:hypothetical protein